MQNVQYIESDLHCISSLYDCENWSVKLREEIRLMIFVKRILKKILIS
jgi:hypothetical protein